ncbi:ATP-dependent DNA helicase PIF1-like [Cotesia typhae]|uniref:ATP-dependent DNA helicase PIF1-like n=1 Tax=Cotesia typhae TaxID=2053667 RepID=UPI003D69899D
MKLLTVGCIFGETKCHMYTIEWQKCGLPHVHILLCLEKKIKPDSIDQIISAELPDHNLDPDLYDIIKSSMIHGPCGSFNPHSPCMVEGKCSKKYPKTFLKETETGEDGYPKYRRRSPADNGIKIMLNGIEIDNRWVVPYNPVLSRTFKAHINVEHCNSVKSIKYICKYINKGSDQTSFTVEDLDEVKKYQSGRYISSSEAVWHIFRFQIHDRFPSVMHLAVHLENGQRIYYNQQNVIEKIINPPKTTLMSFFELCQVDNFAKTLLYVEVPAYYVWKNNKFLRRRKGKKVPGFLGIKKDQVLGRVYTVHPGNAECYYLRLLLHEVRGPTSFLALKTFDGVIQPTFQAACRARGLLEDDANWDHTLEEACISDSPYKIRELFATMLVFCHVGDPLKLWEKYRDYLSEDIQRRIEQESRNIEQVIDIIYNQALILLEDIVLSMSGNTLLKFGLPSPSREEGPIINNRQYLNELAYDTNHLINFVAENVPKLNLEQEKVYSEILNAIDSDSGQLYFLDAPGGTGKTFLINLLLAKIRSVKNIAVAVASSGIAATLIDGGKTAHSAFKLPLNLGYSETPICNISKQSDMAHILRETKIIIWDECTMAHKKAIEALNRTLQDIRDCKRLMGGVIVLLAGDFRQTLPVIRRGTRADEVKACLKSSILWPSVKVLSLTVNMRVHLQLNTTAAEFSKVLIDIGDGNITEIEGKINISSILCDIVPDLISLTNKIYPDIDKAGVNCGSWLKERAILTPTNDQANNINNFLLNKLLTEKVRYDSLDKVMEDEDAVHYPVEFLHTLNPPGIPPHTLNLKIGTPIMLLRNLNPPKLCNGTRLQVKVLYKNVIEATIFTGKYEGENVLIPRIPLIPSDYPFEFKRLQFPIKVCYAMTINKAQGQSLKMAGVDLRNNCFSHGQLYVACSRVSSPENLVILQPDNKTKNVVYKEVLSI